MNHPTTPASDSGFDPELVADFCVEFTDAFESVQTILVDIERAADKHDGLHALFRVLHSIKSNLRMMQLNELSEFVHALEDVLDDMRADRVGYDPRFSDIVLLSLERVQSAFTAAFRGADNYIAALKPTAMALHAVHQDLAHFSPRITAVIQILDPNLLPVAQGAGNRTLADLEFFRHIATFIEQRLGHSENSNARMVQMAEQMNALAGNSIDVIQLRAAVLIHDIGMAFLPAELLRKTGELEEKDRQVVNKHTDLGADLLNNLEDWQLACQMVRQHHERFDGKGYPANVANDAITPGAKLLAIVDTFEAMTCERAHREHKRTVLRAVAEINAQSGAQFDPFWVDIFNQWVRQNYLKK